MVYPSAEQHSYVRKFGFKHAAQITMVLFLATPKMKSLESIKREFSFKSGSDNAILRNSFFITD
jgi:hypothetical protein